jgi:predicted Rossmann-fold nucleotide-binding protein
MEAIAKGVYDDGGQCVGILKGISTDEMNPYIKIPIATRETCYWIGNLEYRWSTKS